MPRRILPQTSISHPRLHAGDALPVGGVDDVARDRARDALVAARARRLLLRGERADRQPELGARLQHPHAGHAQVEVLPVGGLDQLLQDRVAEHGPPAAIRLPRGVERGIAGALPLRRPRRRVVRPDHAAGEQPRENARDRAGPAR
jgi:hypothetical protein